MAVIFYADSSFLVSLYLADSNADKANALLAREQKAMVYISLLRVELRNAFQNVVNLRRASPETFAQACAFLERDLGDGLLVERNLDMGRVFQIAEQLSLRRRKDQVIRCIDLLHVASAHALGLKTFLTFDRQQAAFAKQSGLAVKP